MYRALTSPRFAILLPALLVACSAANGPDLDGAASPEDAVLRRAFPEQASRVLDSEPAFAGGESGFALAPESDGSARAVRGGLMARLPRSPGEAARFELLGGLAVSVRERGLTGEGALAGRAVAYARAGGTSYWAATPTEYEEWLSLAPGVATGDRPAATWDVEGGELRVAGESVEILDEAGVPRLRVAAPEAFTASGRRVMPSLRVRDQAIDLWIDAGGEAVLVDPSWTATMSLKTSRSSHTATLLPNGKVFVAAGLHSIGPCFNTQQSSTVQTPELYDPASGLWTNGPAGSGRQSHTATLLPSGLVLLVGGAGNKCGAVVVSTVERYDPAANAWLNAPPLSTPRVGHSATLLADGRVFVVGGSGGGPTLFTTEIYNPATNTWSPGASLIEPHTHHLAGLLPDGRVVVVGGNGVTDKVVTAEIYDPITNTWAMAASLSHVHDDAAAAVLADGRMVVAGGWHANGGTYVYDGSVEIYDAATNTWSMGPSMPIARTRHEMIRLADGRLLVAGGINSSANYSDTTALYDPLSNTWSTSANMVPGTGAEAQTLTLLPDGKVLAAGGFKVQSSVATAALFDPGAALGLACANGSDCASGFCVDGVCCNTACAMGACDACSVAGGAIKDGTCSALTGPVCNDGDACTSSDVCQSGVCAGAPVVCAAVDQCHSAGACDPASGTCSNPAKADGAGCDDGNGCTAMDACLAGSCKPGSAIACAAMDECHEAGSCDPQGGCSNPAKSEGAPCSVGTCVAGTCTPPAQGTGGAGGTGASSTSAASSTSSTSGAGGAGGVPTSASSSGSTSSSGGSTESSSGGSTASSSGGSGDEGGCGCSVAGAPTTGGLWVTLGLMIAASRRAKRRAMRDG